MPFVIRASCPLCGGTEKTTPVSLPFGGPDVGGFLKQYYAGRVEDQLLKNGTYIIDRCKTCGGMWQREILDDEGMEALYSRWISPVQSHTRRANPALSLQYARHCARLLRLFPKPDQAQLLDYGMGWGDWCHMAQSFGFRVHGVELSEERLAHATSIGIPCSKPENVPAGPYDFIYLEQVLEHLPNPHEVMQALTGMLKPGGYIHIGVPNGGPLEGAAHAKDHAKLLRKGPYQPLEHINIFTPQSLRAFMKSFGCEPAGQREGLLRTDHLLSDVVLAAARYLPAGIFPAKTSVLLQKKQ